MSKKYIGITIGPIFDTIQDASSPAAMWFTSFLFSDLTRRICDKISGESGFGNVEIYSPYYAEEVDIYQDGVGKFHDRILFSIETEEVDYESRLRKLLKEVKVETAVYFENLPQYEKENTEKFLEEYLQIHYLIQDAVEENIILDLSDRLSASELIKTFPKDNSQNPILKLLLGYAEGKNELIKRSNLYRDVRDKQQLEQDGKLRTIETIAQTDSSDGLKLSRYFAVVNSDGDRMGKVLERLGNEEVNQFSEKLFEHASSAAQKIKEFGGMTIYAGGDDLLFLAPILGRDGKSIFSLCNTLRNDFAKMMKEGDDIGPTLSFGISIQYYKYPLYEAMEMSRRMLDAAKSGKKNAVAVNQQKHSGQSLSLKISNENLDKIDQFLQLGANETKESQTLHSMIYSVEAFKGLYDQMFHNAQEEWRNLREKERGEEKFIQIWSHLFDNSSQEKYMAYVKETAKFFYQECVVKEVVLAETLGEDESDSGDMTRMIASLLRLKKFFEEKGGEED